MGTKEPQNKNFSDLERKDLEKIKEAIEANNPSIWNDYVKLEKDRGRTEPFEIQNQDFAGIDLKGYNFENCNFTCASFYKAGVNGVIINEDTNLNRVRVGVLSDEAIQKLNDLNKSAPNYSQNVKDIFKQEFINIPGQFIDELFRDNEIESLVKNHIEFTEKNVAKNILENNTDLKISAGLGLINNNVTSTLPDGKTLDGTSGAAVNFSLDIPVAAVGENNNNIGLKTDYTKGPNGLSFADVKLYTEINNEKENIRFTPAAGVGAYTVTPTNPVANYDESKDFGIQIMPTFSSDIEVALPNDITAKGGVKLGQNSDTTLTGLSVGVKKEVTDNFSLELEGAVQGFKNAEENYKSNNTTLSVNATFTLGSKSKKNKQPLEL